MWSFLLVELPYGSTPRSINSLCSQQCLISFFAVSESDVPKSKTKKSDKLLKLEKCPICSADIANTKIYRNDACESSLNTKYHIKTCFVVSSESLSCRIRH